MSEQPSQVGAGFYSNYDYPSTADVQVLKGPNWEVHNIFDSADPNGSTNYDAAPIGSTYTRILAGSVERYFKADATTWTAT